MGGKKIFFKVRDNIMEGFKEGQQQKAIEDAKKLLADGKYTSIEISKLLNIPVEAFTVSK